MSEFKHFSVIQSLCRVGLTEGGSGFRKQVERLRERFSKDGAQEEAAALDRLLSVDAREATLVPSKVELSRTFLKGQKLTETTVPPSDRETSAPIADVILNPTPSPVSPVLTDELKMAVDAVVGEWAAVEALSLAGLAPPYSCLIFGPPGTGKTLTALYLAEKLRLPVVRARIDGIVSSFLGTTARNLSNLFEFANRYQCILLLDEFDAIAKLRDDPHEVGEIKRVVNTLLQNLDSRAGSGLTIAITNHPSLLDPAVWRRFEVRLEVPAPQFEQRLSLTETFLDPLRPEPHIVRFMAWISEGQTGADIRTMVDTLKRYVAMKQDAKSETAWLEALTAFAARNSGGGQDLRTKYLLSDRKDLAEALGSSLVPAFTQREIADIVSKDQTTVSRWISAKRKSGSEEEGMNA
jgi:SpoVK/Ycf46/Vps4 family AAA+-type ATPase